MRIRFIGGPLHSLVVNVASGVGERIDQKKVNGHPKPTPAMPVNYGTAVMSGDSIDVFHESLMKEGKI